MKAVYFTDFGSDDNLELREVPDPQPPTGSGVLVRVRAAGLNRADLIQRRGLYPPPAGYSPNIPGLEFAGEVAGIGDAVTEFEVGDRVFGIAAGEAQAEFLLANASHLVGVPENVNFVEAAAVPEAFITAHDAVFTLGGLQVDETLLIHAVGSGVGLAALQLAKAKGTVVIGTSRTADKLDNCSAFGLDLGIDTSTSNDFSISVNDATGGRGANVVLDLVGAAYFEQNLLSLAVKGRLILVGLTSGRSAEFNLGLALQRRASIIGTVLRARSAEEKADVTRRFAKEVVPLLASGIVKPTLDRVFPSIDAAAAYQYLGSNQSFGKVVLEF